MFRNGGFLSGRGIFRQQRKSGAGAVQVAHREQDSCLHRLDCRNGFSLYVGIPFCPSVCSYCSFSSSPLDKWKDRVDAYLDALIKEIHGLSARCLQAEGWIRFISEGERLRHWSRNSWSVCWAAFPRAFDLGRNCWSSLWKRDGRTVLQKKSWRCSESIR